MEGPLGRGLRPRALAAAALVLAAAGCGGPRAPELLLLVSVDTLRADYLGAYGSQRGLTPALDELAGESLVFERAYATASFTLPSIASIFTSLYPEELGISRNESSLPEATPTLASALRERGWRTAAVVSNFVLREACGLARGFDLYDDDFPDREATRRWPEREGGATTEAALRTLDACRAAPDAPCFLWVHYQDPHGPYTPPDRERYLELERRAPDAGRQLPVNRDHSGVEGLPGYQLLEGRRDVAFYRAGYAAEVAHVDAALGALFDGLRERGLWERSLVAFVADHGEGLGENDYWFAHGELLSDPLVRVPLMLRIPGRAPARREDLVSLVDLLPTLLRVLGYEAPAPGRGRDLLAEGAEAAASVPYLANLAGGRLPRRALVDGDFKLVTTLRDGIWRGALYRSGRENTDLAAAAPQVARELRARLDALRAELEMRGETPQLLGEEDRRRLEALGYGVGRAAPQPEP